MCPKSCHLIWGIWWFHRSKDFEAMKAGKSAIWPWLSYLYNEHMLVDLPSSVPQADNPCPRNRLLKVALITSDNIDYKTFFLININWRIIWMRHQKDTGPTCTDITDAVCMAIDWFKNNRRMAHWVRTMKRNNFWNNFATLWIKIRLFLK